MHTFASTSLKTEKIMSKLLLRINARRFSGKVAVKITEGVEKLLKDGVIKPRKHPGVAKPKVIELPSWVLKSFQAALEGEKPVPLKMLQEDGKKLARHLLGRHAPIEQEKLREKIDKVKGILEIETIQQATESRKKQQFVKTLKENVYNWKAMNNNRHTSLSYFIARSAQDYAVLYRILNEIKINDKGFEPKTLFDFGSGIGTVLWAASRLWSGSLREYVCVDASSDMNDLSEQLRQHADPKIQTVFHRQFLSSLAHPSFDIVVSAYSLLELPNTRSRLDALAKLWNKSGSYLAIVEQGTNAGFKVVNEARDFILNCLANSPGDDCQKAHVFSPCPHDLSCPRYTTDNTPCNFEVSYVSLPFGQKSQQRVERYTYVIFRKGKRLKEDEKWPRIVRPVLKRSGHTVCRMCTASGDLKEIIFTKSKHDRNVYRCARNSAWGDRLPFHLNETSESEPVVTAGHTTKDESKSGGEPANVKEKLSDTIVEGKEHENNR